jgi:hypothetical protein
VLACGWRSTAWRRTLSVSSTLPQEAATALVSCGSSYMCTSATAAALMRPAYVVCWHACATHMGCHQAQCPYTLLRLHTLLLVAACGMLHIHHTSQGQSIMQELCWPPLLSCSARVRCAHDAAAGRVHCAPRLHQLKPTCMVLCAGPKPPAHRQQRRQPARPAHHLQRAV